MNQPTIPPKTIPYNIEAEEATLGAILIDHGALSTVLTILKPEHFYMQKHAWILESLQAIAQRGEASDLLTLVNELEGRKQLEEVGGAAYITALITAPPSSVNVESYAKLVYDTWRRRRAVELASKVAQVGYNEQTTLDGNLAGILTELSALVDKPKTAEPDALPVPPLPVAIIDQLTAIEDHVGGWIDTYIEYARAAAPMTPHLFHESAALWLASVIIARRLVLPMAFDNVYPSIWAAWIAPSTIFQKSTAMKVAVKTAFRLAPHLVAPEESTPEALIRDMAGLDPENLGMLRLDDQRIQQEKKNFSAQRGWVIDEFSGLLVSTGRDYNAGLIELLLKLYDCTDSYTRSTAGRGLQVIHHAYLTLLSASTPAALAVHLNAERLWGMGWWPRFAILTPEETRPAWAEPWTVERPASLDETLINLNTQLPQPRWPEPLADRPVMLGDGVFALWNQYNKTMRYDLITDALDQRLWYLYGRLPTQALKVATILAALDWKDGAPRVDLPHMARALGIVESWRESAHRAIILAAEEAQDRLRQRVIYQISKDDPLGCTMRDLNKAIRGYKPSDIERALQELLTGGEVQAQETGNPRGGPRTIRYILARD